MHFKSEKIVEKIGYGYLIALFIVFRILDAITTEIGLSKGYIEHSANLIFYSMENRYMSYIVSDIVFSFIIGLSLFAHIYLKKRSQKLSEKKLLQNYIYIFLSANSILLFSFLNVIPVINNFLLINEIYPQMRYDIILFMVAFIIFIIYSIWGVFKFLWQSKIYFFVTLYLNALFQKLNISS